MDIILIFDKIIFSPGYNRKMARVIIVAWAHPQDDQDHLPGTCNMAELHDTRPGPIGLLIKVLGKHHHRSMKFNNTDCVFNRCFLLAENINKFI